MKKTWVLIADEAIVRILDWPGHGHGNELQSVEEITDPLAHAKGAELRRDAEGRRAGGATEGARQGTPHQLRSEANPTASAGEGEQHVEAESFARRVAGHLDAARQQGRFDELHLVAAPRFLGLLRNQLSPAVRDTVVREVDKDFVHFGNADITSRLFPPPLKP